MPTSAHETPLELLRLDPSLPDWVQTELLGDLPFSYDHARLHDSNVRTRTFQADATVLYCDPKNKPVRGSVYEVQRGRDVDKLGTWKLYVGHLEAEFKIKASLVVFVPNEAVAIWYRNLISTDIFSGAWLRPRFFTPDDVPVVLDEAYAAAHPARTLFAAFCHLDDEAKVGPGLPALLAAVDTLAPEMKIFYDREIMGKLPESSRALWKELLVTTTAGRRYSSEVFDAAEARGEARGVARGEARGEARSVLVVLEERGLPVPEEVRQQVLRCTDPEVLRRWLGRAVTVDSAAEVVKP